MRSRSSGGAPGKLRGRIVVEPVVGDDGGDALFEGGGARREQASEANPHERDPLRIDFRQLQGEVDPGVTAFSQSGRKVRPSRCNGPYCPAPSKASAW